MTASPIALSLAALLAGLFVGGCAGLHALRGRAERVTPVLVTLALGLCGLLVLVLSRPAPMAATADLVDPPACYGFE